MGIGAGVLQQGIASSVDMLMAGANAIGNKRSAQRAMDFTERMSSTAYQRSMDDMEKAGLNPLLAAGNGGASTPSGVTSETRMPTNFGERSIAMMQQGLNRKMTDAQVELLGEQAKNTVSQTQLNSALKFKAIADTNVGRKTLDKMEVEMVRDFLQGELHSASAKSVDQDTQLKKYQAQELHDKTAVNRIPGVGETLSTIERLENLIFGGRRRSYPVP